MSTLGIVDTAQVDGYAPNIRYVEDVTKGDVMQPMRMNGLLIVPWMSKSGHAFWESCHRLYKIRNAHLYI